MLVVTPHPNTHESLFGYLIRLSESNGYHTPTVITAYAGYPRGGLITFSSDLQGISEVTGVELNKLKSIGYVRQTDTSVAYYLRGLIISRGRVNWHLWRNQRTVCPACINDLGYIESYWDLKFAVGCPKHGIEGLQACPTCGDKLSWKRPGLLTCHCGAELASNTCQTISNSIRHLLVLLHMKVHGRKIECLDEEFFPKQVRSLTLQELLHLIRILGIYGYPPDQQDQDPKTTINRQLEVAADALANWPNGIHEYFFRLGNYFQHKNGFHVGLRKQFLPFYNAIFTYKPFGNIFEFLRTEFVRFGSESWGSAIIDKKLYRNANHNEIERYLSVTAAAQRLKVSSRTLRRWCAGGHVPCKSVQTKTSKRYVIDSQYIAKFERQPGETMDSRKAAAFLGIPVYVLKQLKSSSFYSSDHLPRIMNGYHQNDLISFKKRLACASSFVNLKRFRNKSHSRLDSVLKTSHCWSAEAKVNLLCAFMDGRIKPVGKATMHPLSVYFAKKQILEFMGNARISDVSGALTLGQGAKLIGCSGECLSEMVSKGVITASRGTGYRTVCANSLKQFDENYLAMNSIARSQSTSAHRLVRLANELQLNLLQIMVPPKGYITSFIERSSLETLLTALQKKREKPLPKEKVKLAEERDVLAIKQYLHKLTKTQEPLPMIGNKLNKVAIAKASGIDRNSIYKIKEIQRLLKLQSKQDVELHDVKIGSQLEILEDFLQNLTNSAKRQLLAPNGKPNKRRIALEAGIYRNVVYNYKKDADKLFRQYLGV